MKKIHFMGIGGSGMNAAAGIALAMGYDVTGCDIKESEYTADLISNSVPIAYGHAVSHLVGMDMLCVSPAVFDLNAVHDEVLYAREHNIPIKTWQQFMGEELQKGKRVIGVAGTKGKTTTSAVLGYVLERTGFDPVVAVGGTLNDWSRNYRVGSGEFFVCESDEYYRNFLHYFPEIAVITNIEMDHPEFFSSYEEYLSSYISFTKNIKEHGYLVIGTDSPGCQELLNKLISEMPPHFKTIGYGFNAPPSNILSFCSSFFQVKIEKASSYTFSYSDILYKSIDNQVSTAQFITLGKALLGDHNILNSMAVIMVGELLKADAAQMHEALVNFKGVGRRFELVCDKNGIQVYNDYAHNPMSVKAVLKAARGLYPEARIWAVFQPHLYSRTKMFLEDFARAFEEIDNVIVTDIYPSREKDKPISREVHSRDLVDKIQALNPSVHVKYIPSLTEAASSLLTQLESGDVVVNIGAGDNGIITDILCQKMQ